MAIIIKEIKARCDDADKVEEILLSSGGRFVGEDHQVDVYFNVEKGKLKLRKGNIESNLIYYEREEVKGIKTSNVSLYPVKRDVQQLQNVLHEALGTSVVVDKLRKIYFIENVKFHIDQVKGLGNFVEIEAIGNSESHSKVELGKQCNYFIRLLNLRDKDLIKESYSDMVATKKRSPL